MLDGVPLTNLTPAALVGIGVILMMLGKLVPRSALMDKDAEVERWRKAYEAEREARATSDAQTAELLEVAKTTHNLIVAMFGTADRIRESGGTDVVPTK